MGLYLDDQQSFFQELISLSMTRSQSARGLIESPHADSLPIHIGPLLLDDIQ